MTSEREADFMAADRALALSHRDDDRACGCDGCMAYGAEDEGFDWYRVTSARRVVLRVLDSGDDRLAAIATAFREHEEADALRATPVADTAGALQAVCAKCRGTDIGVRWDANFYDCLHRQQERGDWPRDGFEHLHHQCRTCGWTWAAALRTPKPEGDPE